MAASIRDRSQEWFPRPFEGPVQAMNVQQPLNYSRVNDAKANFDRIYVETDPREYYRVLYGLDYIIPDLAKGVFRNIIAALERKHGRPIKILDLGCSYGVNAALIRSPLEMGGLAQRYLDLQGSGLTTEELIELDRHYFLSWPRREIEIVGCDISENAISYARAVGLVDHGISANYEIDPVSSDARAALAGVDLIISTGSIGYITERTFAKLLDAIGGPTPWIASFVLRMFPYTKITRLLEKSGQTTEKLQGITFVQRRFHSEEECVRVINELERQGIDPSQKEADGLLHADFYLSRSEAACSETPLDELVSVASGVSRQFGRRYRRGPDNIIRLGR